ncbi:MAG TPA: Gfo/Idh/MocA family oxidoreductase [Rugosimonospora sp.]|nr:Gfo/Idh/MocA family oxidoreductase [Rugosimonospora sp.]
MTEHSIGVALVGAGVIGRNHAAAIGRHPRLRVVAVVDVDPAARAALAGETGAAGYATLPGALADPAVELVAVCTPSGLHVAGAEAALAAGRHVLVEKPVDVALGPARRLAAAADAAAARGIVTTVVSQHRFDPASVAVADAVAAGRFGTITSAVASVAWWRAQAYYDSAGWRGTWALDGGGALANQGVHTADLLLWLLGEPVEVYARTGLLAHHGVEVEDVAVATVAFASGALAVLHATTAAYPGLAVRLSVHGSHGSAVLHDDQLEYFHAEDRDAGGDANQAAEVVAAEEIRGNAKVDDAFVVGHLRQYDDVVEAITNGRTPGVTVHHALLALALVRAVYVSAALGRPVAMADVLAGVYDDTPVRVAGARTTIETEKAGQ